MSGNISGDMSGYAEAYATKEEESSSKKHVKSADEIKELKEELKGLVERSFVLSQILYDSETKKEVSDCVVTLKQIVRDVKSL
jgi:hypothetical protein